MLHSEDAIKRPGPYMSQLKGLLQVVVSDEARTCQMRSAEGMLKIFSVYCRQLETALFWFLLGWLLCLFGDFCLFGVFVVVFGFFVLL